MALLLKKKEYEGSINDNVNNVVIRSMSHVFKQWMASGTTTAASFSTDNNVTMMTKNISNRIKKSLLSQLLLFKSINIAQK